MNAPIDLESGSVQALLARLRAAQAAGGNQETPSQHDATPYQYQPSVGRGQHSGTSTADGSSTYSALTTNGDQSTSAGSVQSLLSSLQNARRPEYAGPSGVTLTYMPLGYQPANAYQQPPSSTRPQYAAPRQTYSFPDAQASRPPITSYPTQHARPPANEPILRDQPSPQPPRRSSPTPPARADVLTPSVPSRRVSPPRSVPQPTSNPSKSAGYDPYDEDFDPPVEERDDDPMESDSGEEAARIEREEREAQVAADREEEERGLQLKVQRNEEGFVNMSFAKASVVVTRLLSDDSVMRRLKELKEEQDKMERTLWQKRLDIVKTHREKMNKAKEEAIKLDPRTADARILKERTAAKRALNQFYTSRCLPFYDDLHRKHLTIMQEELGIPGLGRLESRRKDTTAHPGGAERPILIDSDDEDDEADAEEQEVIDAVVGAEADEERERTLARRKKIMDLIESIMSDGLDV